MQYVVLLIQLAIAIATIGGMWKMFDKAGEPGWAAIVPFYNIFVMLKIIGRPAWWLVLFFIPIVSFIAAILVFVDMAKAFGKGAGFGIGMVVLPFVFIPMLGFGDAQYQGPVHQS